MATYALSINGRTQTVEAVEDMPLLWVLRDLLNLRGTKFGCGMGLCGACTVHLDGVAVRACQVPVASIGTQRVVTIEGLDPGAPQKLTHPVLKAWCAEDVAQCGYCQSGQIMTAAALLTATPKPSSTEIDGAMAGNLCRCATYLRIRRAVQRAAGTLPADAPPSGAELAEGRP